MEPLSVYDESVIVRIEEWLNTFGEALIEPYYPYGGSSGTRYFISSLSGFHNMVAKAPAGEVFGAVYFIYRPPRFPLVGTVDGDFIQLALSEVQEGTWCLIVATDDYYPAELSTFGEGESRRELEQEFEECRGCQVRFGELPLGPEAWWATSGDDSVIVARKT
jgi:hypothetical protein